MAERRSLHRFYYRYWAVISSFALFASACIFTCVRGLLTVFPSNATACVFNKVIGMAAAHAAK
jgi:hypothetical protein